MVEILKVINTDLSYLKDSKESKESKKSKESLNNDNLSKKNYEIIPDDQKIRHFSKRNINEYKNFKEKTEYGKHAKGVQILKNIKRDNDFIVQKTYDKKHQNIFFNEVYWLLKLQKTGYFPKIIRIDPKRFTFWMTYCGSCCTGLSKEEFSKYEKEIRRAEIDLYENYNCFHNDIKPSNVCIRNNKIYLIDCGWMDEKIILPGYTPGRYGFLFPQCFSEMKEKCLNLLALKKDVLPVEFLPLRSNVEKSAGELKILPEKV